MTTMTMPTAYYWVRAWDHWHVAHWNCMARVWTFAGVAEAFDDSVIEQFSTPLIPPQFTSRPNTDNPDLRGNER